MLIRPNVLRLFCTRQKVIRPNCTRRNVTDPAGRCVSRAGSGELVCSLLSSASADALSVKLRQLPPAIRTLLEEFPAVMNDELPPGTPRHDFHHIIETKGRPLHAKTRCLDPAKLAADKA